jgi:hypothetical protein
MGFGPGLRLYTLEDLGTSNEQLFGRGGVGVEFSG